MNMNFLSYSVLGNDSIVHLFDNVYYLFTATNNDIMDWNTYDMFPLREYEGRREVFKFTLLFSLLMTALVTQCPLRVRDIFSYS